MPIPMGIPPLTPNLRRQTPHIAPSALADQGQSLAAEADSPGSENWSAARNHGGYGNIMIISANCLIYSWDTFDIWFI